jgi:hypothetical protein
MVRPSMPCSSTHTTQKGTALGWDPPIRAVHVQCNAMQQQQCRVMKVQLGRCHPPAVNTGESQVFNTWYVKLSWPEGPKTCSM